MELIRGTSGGLTLDGFVLRTGALPQVGLMAIELQLDQDTEFIIRCGLALRLYPGALDLPVAMEGVHEKNRFSAPRTQTQELRNKMKYWLSLYDWTKKNSPVQIRTEVRRGIVHFIRTHRYFKRFPRSFSVSCLIWFTRLLRLLTYPRLLLDMVFDR